jgi:hypothetical protein
MIPRAGCGAGEDQARELRGAAAGMRLSGV